MSLNLSVIFLDICYEANEMKVPLENYGSEGMRSLWVPPRKETPILG